MIDLKHSHLRKLPKQIMTKVPKESFDYPKAELKKLIIYRLSKIYNVKINQICIGNGSAEIIDAITNIWGRNSTIFAPTFFLYEFYLKKYRRKPHIIFWAWNNNHNLDLTSMQFKSSLIWISNPNNPTGHWVNPQILHDIAYNMNSIVAVDENFMAFKDPNAKPLSVKFQLPNILSVRSFSKEFGLPGLRLGYCIGPPLLIKRITSVLEPYSVNAFALKYGLLALDYINEYRECIYETIRVRNKMYNDLRRIGYHPMFSYGNFISIKFKNNSELVMVKNLLIKRGIESISYSHWEFTSNNEPIIRISIPTSEEYGNIIKIFEKIKEDYEDLF